MISSELDTIRRRNETTQERLTLLTIQKKRTMLQVRRKVAGWKRESGRQFRTFRIRFSAAKFVQSYRHPFVVFLVFSRTFGERSQYQIRFAEEAVARAKDPYTVSGETIPQFIDFMLSKGELLDELVATGNDPCGIGSVLKAYLGRIYDRIRKDSGVAFLIGAEPGEEGSQYMDIDLVYKEVEAHIASQLHHTAFAGVPTAEDRKFSNTVCSLAWMTPVQFGIKEKAAKYGFWRAAIDSTSELDNQT